MPLAINRSPLAGLRVTMPPSAEMRISCRPYHLATVVVTRCTPLPAAAEIPVETDGSGLRLGKVNASDHRVRRATLDDIGELTALWQSMGFAIEDLAKRVTEFQVLESAEGGVVGAVGLQISERQGLIHNEAFTDFALADPLRPLLWERLLALATNHGLHRLWTREAAPFWHHCGLERPEPEMLEKLPALWRGHTSGWLTIKLKEDIEAVISADKEFALFMQSERQRTERALQHARALKQVATLIAVILLILVLGAAFWLVMKNPQLLHRGR
jgi:N-acetylglutamate synthase-like GNAT family acetyltransferase